MGSGSSEYSGCGRDGSRGGILDVSWKSELRQELGVGSASDGSLGVGGGRGGGGGWGAGGGGDCDSIWE